MPTSCLTHLPHFLQDISFITCHLDCKGSISGLGANITDNSIRRVGKCIGRLQSTLHQYDSVNNIKQESGSHTCHSTNVDLSKLLKQLNQSSVFDFKSGRVHRPKFTTNLVKKVSKEKLLQWMHDRMQKLLLYH